MWLSRRRDEEMEELSKVVQFTSLIGGSRSQGLEKRVRHMQLQANVGAPYLLQVTDNIQAHPATALGEPSRKCMKGCYVPQISTGSKGRVDSSAHQPRVMLDYSKLADWVVSVLPLLGGPWPIPHPSHGIHPTTTAASSCQGGDKSPAADSGMAAWFLTMPSDPRNLLFFPRWIPYRA